MATTLTAPGVYIEELPSGTRTITGVSTSLTAFVGAALRGPVDEPTKVSSWSEYERLFGGLSVDSPMSQSVRHYFANGGAEALIVRVVHDDAAVAAAELPLGLTLVPSPTVAALPGFDHLTVTVANSDDVAGTFDLDVTAEDATGGTLQIESVDCTISLTGLAVTTDYAAAINAEAIATAVPTPIVRVLGTPPTSVPSDVADVDSAPAGPGGGIVLVTDAVGLEAANEGAWGDRLRMQGSTEDAVAGSFHLTVTLLSEDLLRTVVEETFMNVTADAAGARFLGRILELQSALVRFDGTPAPSATTAALEAVPFTGGDDGTAPDAADLAGNELDRTGIYALLEADLFNILCLPMASWSVADNGERDLWERGIALCERERAFLIIDPPEEWVTAPQAAAGANTFSLRSENAALYFPRVKVPDPLQESRLGEFAPCGVVAGAYARTDARRGIWKAPAGIDVTLAGVPELSTTLTDPQQGDLNVLGINCLRSFPVYGRVVWGARTLRGADIQASEWKYVPVRRLALYIEESVLRGSRWAVFEPNDEPLWAELRLGIGGFLHQLFRQGAFQGSTPAEAYFVKCDRETTLPSDINNGIVNVLVGIAPVKPSEFVIIKLQQLASQAGQ